MVSLKTLLTLIRVISRRKIRSRVMPLGFLIGLIVGIGGTMFYMDPTMLAGLLHYAGNLVTENSHILNKE